MPGVPPDAVNQLKRAFKGLFRKKPKDSKNTSTSTNAALEQSTSAPAQQPSTTQQSQSPSTAPAAASSTHPPPAQQQQAPELAEPQQQLDGTKPLPPTHPLATGQIEQQQEAIPTNDTNSAAAPDPNIAGGPAGASALREQEHSISPVGGNSEPVSAVSAISGEGEGEAVEKDSMPATPMKEGKGVRMGETSAHPTLAAQRLDPAAESTAPTATTNASPEVAKENVPPTTSTPPTTAATNAAPPAATANGTTAPAYESADEGKMLAAEPETSTLPPPPPVLASGMSGMSATSGPLPDYPEGDHLPASTSMNANTSTA